MTSIVPGSARIMVDQRPAIKPLVIRMGDVSFESTGLGLSGTVTLQGSATDSPADWAAGFIQLQFVETNWAYYRGQVNNDGCALIQVGRSPARHRQACRDTLDFPHPQPVNDIFYGPPGVSLVGGANLKFQDSVNAGSFPIALRPRHIDYPSERKRLIRTNSKTGKPNYLQATQLEFHFCALLAVRDPAGRFHILQHLYWNVRWQATFQARPSTPVPNSPVVWSTPQVVAAGTGATVSAVYNGNSLDPRFSTLATTLQMGNCNAVASTAEANPIIRESNLWQTFDVRL